MHSRHAANFPCSSSAEKNSLDNSIKDQVWGSLVKQVKKPDWDPGIQNKFSNSRHLQDFTIFL